MAVFFRILTFLSIDKSEIREDDEYENEESKRLEKTAMWIQSLDMTAVVRAIQADRRAEAEQWRQATAARRGSTSGRAGHELASWLTLAGEVVADLDPCELEHRRPALQAVVDELLAGGRDAGLDLAVHVDEDDDPLVLARTLGWLAGRTAGTAIPLSRLRRRRLSQVVRPLAAGLESYLEVGSGDLRCAA